MYRKNRIRIRVAAVICMIACICSGCVNPQLDTTLVGSLRLSCAMATSQTILPEGGSVIHHFDVAATGPNETTVTLEGQTGTSVVLDGLAFGEWSIRIDAFNASNEHIGYGEQTTVVDAGENSCTIHLVRGTTPGNASICIQWPNASYASSYVEAVLTPQDGEPRSADFVNRGEVDAIYSEELDPGYYTLSMKVFFEGSLRWQRLEALYILASRTTSAVITLLKEDYIQSGMPLAGIPSYSVGTGSYVASQNVSISSTTPGATIRYTINGPDPTREIGTIYSEPIVIIGSATLKAVAYADGFEISGTAVASYSLSLTAGLPAPTLSTTQVTHLAGFVLELSSSWPSNIYYTTDDTEPTVGENAIHYTGPISISEDTIISAIVDNGSLRSNVVRCPYMIRARAAAPAFSVPPGTYSDERSVTLTTDTPGAVIYFTTDGLDPRAIESWSTSVIGVPYNGEPIKIDRNMTIRAFSRLDGIDDSELVSADYSVVVAPPVYDPPGGLYYNPVAVDVTTPTPSSLATYSSDGTLPLLEGGGETLHIEVDADSTLRFLAYRDGWPYSNIVEAAYEFATAPPTVRPAPGAYSDTSVVVTFESDTIGADFRYTLDGTDPLSGGTDSNTATITFGDTLSVVALSAFGTTAPASPTYTLGVTTVSPGEATTIEDTTPDIDWPDSAIAETGYHIVIATDESYLDALTPEFVTSSDYPVVTPLENFKVHYWKTRPVFSGGTGDWGPTHTMTVWWAGTISGLMPQDTAEITDTTPELEWDDRDDAISYEVRIGDTAADVILGTSSVYTTNESSYIPINPLANLTTHYWSVRAIGVGDNGGEWSDPISFDLRWGQVEGIAPVEGTTVDRTDPQFAWDSVAGAVGYEIRIVADNANDLGSVTPIEVPGTTYTPQPGLSNLHTHYWQVRAVDADDQYGPWTDPSSIDVAFGFIIGMTPSNGTVTLDSTPTLDWDDTPNASTYKVFIADTFAGVDAATPVVVNESSYTVPADIADNASIWWCVVATDQFGFDGETSAILQLTADVYSVGESGPAGGIVFYDKGDYSDGWRYLEVAPSDLPVSVSWGPWGHYYNVTGSGIGTGEANTGALAVALYWGNYAAVVAETLEYAGFDDWFLPSKDEMTALVDAVAFLSGLQEGYYWTSTEVGEDTAWWGILAGNSLGVGWGGANKQQSHYVRVIRSF